MMPSNDLIGFGLLIAYFIAAGLFVAGAMVVSAAAMLAVAVPRLSAFEPGGNVEMGLAIAVLGVLTNGWFWRRYAALTREQYSAVIDAQQKLYRAKTGVDLCVAAALAAVVIAPAHPATRYVDLLGSLLVAGYLFWNGVRMAQPHLGSLGDRLRASLYQFPRKD